MFRTIRIALLPLVALGLVFAAACGGDDDDTGTPSPTTPAEPTNTPDTGDPTEEPADPTGEPATPTSEPTEAPEPESPAVVDGAYAPGTRTGDAQLDAIIAAIESDDPAALAALLKYSSIECQQTVEGLGGGPECPDGVPDGSLVNALPMTECEGYYVLEDEADAVTSMLGSGQLRLFAAFAQTDPGSPAFATGDTVLLYLDTDHGFGRMVNVEDGAIVSVYSGCGATPQDHIDSRDPADFVLAPAVAA